MIHFRLRDLVVIVRLCEEVAAGDGALRSQDLQVAT